MVKHYCELCKKEITTYPINEVVLRDSAHRDERETIDCLYSDTTTVLECVRTPAVDVRVLELCPDCNGRVESYIAEIEKIYRETYALSGSPERGR